MTSRTWTTLAAPTLKVLVFLLVTALATDVLVNAITNAPDTATASYSADFSDVTGVSPGDDVRISGVKVGKVTSLSLVGHNTARVGFTVLKSRRLPHTTHATLKFLNLIGNRYLSLTPGAGDPKPFLPPGSVIPQSQTTDALDLTALASSFQPLDQLVDPAQLNALATSLIAILQGEGGSIQQIVARFGDVFGELAANRGAITELVGNLDAVATTVAQHDSQLGSLISELSGWLGGLAANRGEIGAAITEVGTLAQTLNNLLSTTRAPLHADIAKLGDLSGTLVANQPTITKALSQIPQTAAELTGPASYGGWLNFYLCQAYAPSGLIVPTITHLPPSGKPVDQRCLS